MKASKRCRRASKLKKDEGIALDAEVWSKLQDHISLKDVYEKLPYQELFRLRLVCKAWNHAALQRLEPKPYFVIIARGNVEGEDDVYMNGILSYDVASENYSFKQQHFPLYTLHPTNARYYSEPFEVEGLIYCRHPDNLGQQGVFNIHNKTWHTIPPAPKHSEYRSAIGMMVDTSERPYSFKLVVGSLDTKTQIYDSQSRSWSTTSSRLKQLAKQALRKHETVTCVCSNGCVYISIGAEILLLYSMEEDKWTILDFPEVKQEEEGAVHALGVWEGRIFTTREDCSKRKIIVWELVDQAKEEWVKYVIISSGNYNMLMECDFFNHGPSIYEDLRVIPCFCDGYLLLYNWHYSGCQSYALGMLNLGTSEWEKVDLPPGIVAYENDTDEDSEMEESYGFEGGSGLEGSDEDSGEDDNSEKEGDSSKSEDSSPGCAAQATDIRRNEHGVRSKIYYRRYKGADIVRSKIAHHRQIGCRENKGNLSVDQAAEVVPSVTSGVIAEKPSPSIGNIVMKPPLAVTAGNPSSTIGSIVMKSSCDNACAICKFEADVPDDYEAHRKTKVHRFLEQLREEKKYCSYTPLALIHEYVSKNRRRVNYEIKHERGAAQYEVIAIVSEDSGRTAGLPTKGFARNDKRQIAKQMAAADALERIMANVSESEFTNMFGRKLKHGGGKSRASDDGSVGAGGGGNPGGSGKAVSGLGNPGDSSSSGKGVSEGGGNPGENGGSGRGVGGGGGSYPSNPNAIPIPGYNDASLRASSLTNNVDKYAGQGGTSNNLSWQRDSSSGMPRRPEICTEKKLPKRTESYIGRVQGGRGHAGSGYAGRGSFGGVGVGSNSYGISAYGQHSQGPPLPHHNVLGQAQHMPVRNFPGLFPQYIFTPPVQPRHDLTQHVHDSMRINMVGGGGPGGTPYSIYEATPQSTVSRVATGIGQTLTQTHNNQYGPATLGYNSCAINQEYVVNAANRVQEMAPESANAMQSLSVAQYEVMQPQQQVPPQLVGYAFQGAMQHQQP